MIIKQLSNLYLKNMLNNMKQELEDQYTAELQKQKYFENSVDKHNNSHIKVLENLQKIQKNLGIVNNALSEIALDDDLIKEHVYQQLNLLNITDIKIKPKQ